MEHLGSINVPSCTSEYLHHETLKNFLHKGNTIWKVNSYASRFCQYCVWFGLWTRNQVTNNSSNSSMVNLVTTCTTLWRNWCFLKNLYHDVSIEFEFSLDCLDLLQQLTFHLGMKFRKPVNYISCCWLSVYDTSSFNVLNAFWKYNWLFLRPYFENFPGLCPVPCLGPLQRHPDPHLLRNSVSRLFHIF